MKNSIHSLSRFRSSQVLENAYLVSLLELDSEEKNEENTTSLSCPIRSMIRAGQPKLDKLLEVSLNVEKMMHMFCQVRPISPCNTL
ncbi:hypothetical protein RRG08_038851 [Elysia crispata]|uniref:Uncharacterized protein n=1 Tax=Elysia crispata TaxID=231223 RepID=A0AAE1D3X5_9GAST|nr:hypothetical protein RRG08_038851 [Elysia crispata]